ncbi:uncharacterized protein [Acropora muricata]|uniref:uncharacterized protein isoform X1 n=1 Tax=Acropora muricata TaxID=159855 RepID=UPI0034E42607
MDQRHVGMKSSTMEKQVLHNSITMPGSADAFKDGFHSLDVWHKAKSIRKNLLKVSNVKETNKIAKWSEKSIKHFWYFCGICFEGCSTDDEALDKLKDKWIGLVPHIHEWPSETCELEELPEEHALPLFDRHDKDFQALQKIILEPFLLESMAYYMNRRAGPDLR